MQFMQHQSVYTQDLEEKMVKLDSEYFEGRVHIHRKYAAQPKSFIYVDIHIYKLFSVKHKELTARIEKMFLQLEPQQAIALAQVLRMDLRDFAKIRPDVAKEWSKNNASWQWKQRSLLLPANAHIKTALEEKIQTAIGKKAFSQNKTLFWKIFETLELKPNSQTTVSELKPGANFLLHGNVKPEQEKNLLQKLGEQIYSRDYIKLPSVSWTNELHPGFEHRLNYKGVKISYVPRHQKRKQTKSKGLASYRISKEIKTKMVEEETENYWGIAGNSADEFYKVGDHVVPIYQINNNENFIHQCENPRTFPESAKFELAALTGKEAYVQIHGKTYFGKISIPSKEDMIKAGYLAEDGFYNHETRKKDLTIFLSPDQQESLQAKIQRIKELPEIIQAEFEVDVIDSEDPEAWKYEAYDAINKHVNQGFQLSEHIAFSEGEPEYQRIQSEEELNSAPQSDLGNITVEAATPEQALQALQDLGIAKKALPRAYGPENFQSRYRKHPEYHKEHKPILLPPGTMPLHGMSAGDDNFRFRPVLLMNSLSNIVSSGGLLSTATRRARGLVIQTTSPGGDIASGIDRGVGTTIGPRPYIGNDIVFVIKPEALHRNRIFFSDRDFGGGHNRFEKYNQYAQSLGQKDIFDPPSPQSRQKHMLYHTDIRTNEAWLYDKISLDEMMAWIVDEEFYDEIEAKAKEWKQNGLLPKDLTILKENGEQTIENHVKNLWTTYYQKFFDL